MRGPHEMKPPMYEKEENKGIHINGMIDIMAFHNGMQIKCTHVFILILVVAMQ